MKFFAKEVFLESSPKEKVVQSQRVQNIKNTKITLTGRTSFFILANPPTKISQIKTRVDIPVPTPRIKNAEKRKKKAQKLKYLFTEIEMTNF